MIRKLSDIERDVILHALKYFDGCREKMARALGISRRTIQYKLDYYRHLGYIIPYGKSSKKSSGKKPVDLYKCVKKQMVREDA